MNGLPLTEVSAPLVESMVRPVMLASQFTTYSKVPAGLTVIDAVHCPHAGSDPLRGRPCSRRAIGTGPVSVPDIGDTRQEASCNVLSLSKSQTTGCCAAGVLS